MKITVYNSGGWFLVKIEGVPGSLHISNTFLSHCTGTTGRFEIDKNGDRAGTSGPMLDFPADDYKTSLKAAALYLKKRYFNGKKETQS